MLDLSDECRLPWLGELDGRPDFADVRLAWHPTGIAVTVEVRGRSNPLNCLPSAASISDGLHVWFDTRNTQTVHRATKFCHQFCLLPTGGGTKQSEPVAVQIPLARSREETTLADVSRIRLRSNNQKDGYRLEAWLPAEIFVGFDPESHSRLGFHYVVRDRDLGDQTLAVGTEFPADSDPSLWQTIELLSS
jgi:hypothetical protein